MSDKTYQNNPSTPYLTTNPNLNNPLQGVSLDNANSACAQHLLLKSFSGGTINKKYSKKSKKSKKGKKSKKNKKSKKYIKNKKNKKNRKSKKSKKSKRKTKKKIFKGGSPPTDSDSQDCNHTGQTILDSGAKLPSKVPSPGYGMVSSQASWSYKPPGHDGQSTDFTTHHLVGATRGAIANNQNKNILSNYLLENADSGKCQNTTLS